MSIAAEVATKTSFGRLNAAKVKPRTAPPVPIIPAMPPEMAPASTATQPLAGNSHASFHGNAAENTIRNEERGRAEAADGAGDFGEQGQRQEQQRAFDADAHRSVAQAARLHLLDAALDHPLQHPGIHVRKALDVKACLAGRVLA